MHYYLPAILRIFNISDVTFKKWKVQKRPLWIFGVRQPKDPNYLQREIALQIAFTGALVGVGYDHSTTKRIVASWIMRESVGVLPAFWIGNKRAGTAVIATSLDDVWSLTKSLSDSAVGLVRRSPASLAIINLREIVDRVDSVGWVVEDERASKKAA